MHTSQFYCVSVDIYLLYHSKQIEIHFYLMNIVFPWSTSVGFCIFCFAENNEKKDITFSFKRSKCYKVKLFVCIVQVSENGGEKNNVH